jgi:ankyrin repeat protein
MGDNDKPRLFSPGIGKKGMTPAHFAAYCGDRNALIAALAERPDINLPDTYRGYTPLHWLCDMAAVDGPRVEMLGMLLGAGADVNLKSGDGMTPLALAMAAGSSTGDDLAIALREAGAVA